MGQSFVRAFAQQRRARVLAAVLTAVAIVTGSLVAAPAPAAQAAIGGDNYPTSLSAIPQDSVVDPWRFYNRECTSFVAWRLNGTNKVDNFTNQYGGSDQWWGNAVNWGVAAKAKGIRVDNLPAAGSVAWSTSGAAGHVAWVAAVLPGGKISIEEYNWRLNTTDERGRYNTRTVLASSFAGFIHIKDLNTWPPSDGTYIRVDGGAEIYRIAGGAPIYVSSWAPFGGAQQTQTVSAAQFATLPKLPADGTYIRGQSSGDVYTIAGGAPIHVTSWNNVGGEKRVVGIDDAAIRNAHGPGVWQHLRLWPVDTFIRGAVSKRIFRVVASGHPYYVSSWEPYGGGKPFTDVDDSSIDSCNHLNCDPWGHLDAATGAGGAVSVSGWAQDPNTTNAVAVHIYIDNTYLGAISTGATRKDVDRAYHRGTTWGFNWSFMVGPGAHTMCAYAINAGRGSTNTQLGCLVTTVT